MMISTPTAKHPEVDEKRDLLLGILADLGSVAVAFSGGVDSTVVAKGAFLALGSNAIAITADSPSVARKDLAEASRLAGLIGIRHEIVQTSEFQDPDYQKNDGSRCYYCKSELYSHLVKLAPVMGLKAICSGANLDDLGDYRPGLIAASEKNVRHPLQEAGFTKKMVRELAQAWGLPNWDRPASPCLSSRLAPGVVVTAERTARIEAAEDYLHRIGFRECRVRLHEGDLARIEVASKDVAMLAAPELRQDLVSFLQSLGFRYISLDLEGFRSGNLNALISLDKKKLYSRGIDDNQS